MPALRAAALAGVLLVVGFIAGRLGSEAMQLGSYVLALVVGGWTFVPEAVKNLLQRRINIGTLMAVAAAGAVVLGQIGEAASLAFLFSISEALEAFALVHARRSLRALLSIVPSTATVLKDGGNQQVPVSELAPGDLMLIRAGGVPGVPRLSAARASGGPLGAHVWRLWRDGLRPATGCAFSRLARRRRRHLDADPSARRQRGPPRLSAVSGHPRVPPAYRRVVRPLRAPPCRGPWRTAGPRPRSPTPRRRARQPGCAWPSCP